MLRRLAAFLRERGIDIKSAHRRRSGDPAEVQRRLLSGRTSPVVIDVGAHHGRLSRQYKAMFPGATVYAFEPTPASYAVLLANTGGIAGINPVNAAAGDLDGALSFYVSADDEQTSSALARADGRGREVRVPCVRLDTFCRERGIARVDLLKIDVEGFELAVLRGASGLLDRGDVDVILAEVSPEPLRPGAATLVTLGQHLDALGYHLFGMYNMIWHRDLRIFWFDAIWISGAMFRRCTGTQGGRGG